MMNLHTKKARLVISILAIILVLAMIVPFVASAIF